MKKLMFALIATTVMVAPSLAQGQNDISLPEFRQTLSDYLTAADSYRGTNYASLLVQVPDATLMKWYGAVSDGRRFQSAVRHIKDRMLARKPATRRPGVPLPSAPAGQMSASRSVEPRFALNAASFGAGIASTPVPDYALFPPAYASGSYWESMTGTLQTFGYLPSGDVSNIACDTNMEADLTILTSTFHAIKDLADQICSAIPDPVVIILGEGTKVPAKEICYGINLIIGAFNSAFDGLKGDCDTNDALIQGAHIEAAYYNSIALYNLEFRLSVEENLSNTSVYLGLFEVPNAKGGYLEQVRAIVGDTLYNMTIAGVNTASAQISLNQGDTYYNQNAWKLAFKQYQSAYFKLVQ